MPTPKDAIKKYTEPWSLLTAEQLAFMGASAWSFQKFRHWHHWPSVNDYQKVWQKSKRPDFNQNISFSEQLAIGQRSRRKLREKLRKQNKTLVDTYVESIILEQRVPTRPQNWHDFFNFNIWLSFAESKWSLHHRFYTSRGTNRTLRASHYRTSEEDLLTSLDEGGALLACLPEELESVSASLKSRNIEKKSALILKPNIEFVVFGHGVIESVLAGECQLNLLTIPIPVPFSFFQSDEMKKTEFLDCRLAKQIKDFKLDLAGSFPLFNQ
ncbi:MAG: DUF3025 domain-containing protein [Oligoflexales bacterium]